MTARTHRWLVTLLALALFGALGASGCNHNGVDDGVIGYDDDYTAFDDWDLDDDDYIDTNEFRGGYDTIGYYDDWDLDRDGIVEDDEFGDSLFSMWDTNADRMLDANEVDRGTNDWFDNEMTTGVDAWDADDDGMLDDGEFDDYLGDNDYYGNWDLDRDGLVEDDELGEGLFGAFDRDGDELIGDDEFWMT